jgi:hypothetical protein
LEYFPDARTWGAPHALGQSEKQWSPADGGRLDNARKGQLISLVLFALAMAEKETALILPSLLLAYE